LDNYDGLFDGARKNSVYGFKCYFVCVFDLADISWFVDAPVITAYAKIGLLIYWRLLSVRAENKRRMGTEDVSKDELWTWIRSASRQFRESQNDAFSLLGVSFDVEEDVAPRTRVEIRQGLSLG